MLSNQGAKILLSVRNEEFDEIHDFNTFKFLQEKKYIEYSPDKTAHLSPLGDEVLDDYLHAQELKSIAEKANFISTNANDIAKKSNDIARKSNRKANISNIIALVSLITAILVAIFK